MEKEIVTHVKIKRTVHVTRTNYQFNVTRKGQSEWYSFSVNMLFSSLIRQDRIGQNCKVKHAIMDAYSDNLTCSKLSDRKGSIERLNHFYVSWRFLQTWKSSRWTLHAVDSTGSVSMKTNIAHHTVNGTCCICMPTDIARSTYTLPFLGLKCNFFYLWVLL